MTEVGQLFAIFAIAILFGNLLSGAMTDKFGRRVMLLFGLVFSALSSLTMGFVNDLGLFYSLAGLVELLSNTGGPAQQAGQSMLQTMGGYGSVLRDSVYMAFLVASTLMVIVYMQMNSTLSVYLRDVHSVSTQGYGYILSLNAGMVVLFQFWVTRRTHNRAPHGNDGARFIVLRHRLCNVWICLQLCVFPAGNGDHYDR